MIRVTMAKAKTIDFRDPDWVVQLPHDLGENPAALKVEYARLPGERSFWRNQRTLASTARAAAKLELEREQARARLRLKGQLTTEKNFMVDASGRRVTADDFDALVTLDDGVVRAADALVAADEVRQKLEDVVDAMGDKKEMLISLGAQVRTELESDPSIRSRR